MTFIANKQQVNAKLKFGQKFELFGMPYWHSPKLRIHFIFAYFSINLECIFPSKPKVTMSLKINNKETKKRNEHNPARAFLVTLNSVHFLQGSSFKMSRGVTKKLI